MRKSASKKSMTFSKVVISSKRGTDNLEVFRGYGIYSRRGIFLEAYADDFQYALGRLQVLNNPHPPSGKLTNLQDRLDEDEDPEKEAADDDEDV